MVAYSAMRDEDDMAEAKKNMKQFNQKIHSQNIVAVVI